MSPSLEPREQRPRAVGVVALVLALAVYYAALRWITPAIAQRVEGGFPASAGPHLFLQHLLTFSLPTAALCALTWFALARLGWIAPPRPWLGLGPNPVSSLRWGALVGLALTALVLVVGIAAGERVHFHPSGWKIAGNLFSNFYEELEYRGLLLQAGWAATGNRAAAVVISSVVFGWSHGHGSHAVVRMIAAGLAGLIFGFLALRTRSLGGPWVAHQVSDAILDSL